MRFRLWPQKLKKPRNPGKKTRQKTMDLDSINKVAESRILEAIENGEFENLPGAGRPLDLTADSAVPEDLRVAYRMLKNAGFVPPEVAKRAEIAQLQAWLVDPDQATEDGEIRHRALRRLSLLMTELERSGSTHLAVEDEYYRKIVDKVSG